nr:uncharacterized protein LOC109779774 [Aegilops tauschii subsp. strangulata]
MSDQSGSQNGSEEQVQMSEGSDPSSTYDDGSRSTPSNLPKAATRSRKKRTSESEDEDYIAIEEEVSSKKMVLKKEYGTAAATKPGMKTKAPARRIPMSKPRRVATGETMKFTIESDEEGVVAAVPLGRRPGLPPARGWRRSKKSRTPKVKATLEVEAPAGAAIAEVVEAEGAWTGDSRVVTISVAISPGISSCFVERSGRGFGAGIYPATVRAAAQPPSSSRNKTFARALCLMDGNVLYFKLAESDLLSIKVFGRSGHMLGYCAESSTDGESSSSGESDEEDTDSDDEGSGREDDGSD